MHTVTIDEHTIAWREASSGESDESVLVFLHGFALDHRQWAAQSELHTPGYRQLFVDLPGFGGSSPPRWGRRPVMIDDYARILWRWLDEVAPRLPCVLVGLSMGGYVAMAMHRIAPERLHGLIFTNTKEEPDSPQARQARVELASHLRSAGPAAVVAAFGDRLFSPKTLTDKPEVAAQAREMMLAAPAEGIELALEAMAARPGSAETLQTFTRPSLVIGGADDALCPPRTAASLCTALPNSNVFIVPDSGHLTPMEQPGAWAEHVRHYLQRL